MKLYHYSLFKQPVLKPHPLDLSYGRLIAQSVMGDARLPKTPGLPWTGGLLFFQEALPMPLLDEVVENYNPHFPKGVEIYEYMIEANAISDELFYYVLDPTELIDFVPGPPGTGESYPEKWLKVMTRNGFMGDSVEDLNSTILRLQQERSISERFRELVRFGNLFTLRSKYTLGFPMVYLRLRSGFITPNQIRIVSH